jgi:hypothetical protein
MLDVPCEITGTGVENVVATTTGEGDPSEGGPPFYQNADPGTAVLVQAAVVIPPNSMAVPATRPRLGTENGTSWKWPSIGTKF